MHDITKLIRLVSDEDNIAYTYGNSDSLDYSTLASVFPVNKYIALATLSKLSGEVYINLTVNILGCFSITEQQLFEIAKEDDWLNLGKLFWSILTCNFELPASFLKEFSKYNLWSWSDIFYDNQYDLDFIQWYIDERVACKKSVKPMYFEKQKSITLEFLFVNRDKLNIAYFADNSCLSSKDKIKLKLLLTD